MSATNIDLGVFVRLHDKLLGPLRKSENDVAAASKRMNKNLKLTMKLAGAGAAAAGIAAASKRMVDAALEPVRAVEKAKGELASLGVENVKLITDAGKAMEGQWAGITADGFTRAAYDIRSGISSLSDQGVVDMTRAASLVAKATKGVPEEMTSLFATGYGIFKKQYAGMRDADFGLLFGDMIAASVQQFKTDGAQMQAAIESAGATATNYGMAMSDQFAVLGQLQATMSGSEAGTALRAFAAKAGEANSKFAKLAAESGNPIKVRILDENNMMRAMPDILTDIKARYGDVLDAAEGQELAKALGSEEAVKVIQSLYGQEEAVRANAKALEDAANSGGKFTKTMATSVDDNMDARLQVMNQKWNVMKMTLGEKLMPVVERLTPVIGAVIDKVIAFADANPKLAGGIAMAIVAIGALAAVLAPILLVSASLVGSFGMLTGGLGKLARVFTIVNGKPTMFQRMMIKLGGGVRALAGKIYGLARSLLTVGTRWTVTAAKFTIGKIKAAGSAIMTLGRKGLVASKRFLLAGAGYVKMAARFTAGKIIGAISGLAKLGRAAMLAGGAFFKAGLMMMLSPIGLVVTAVAAIAGAAYLIYANWDKVGPYFMAIWQGVQDVFFAVIDWAKSAFLNFTPAGLIYTHWDSIAVWFGQLWEGVKAAFFTVIDWAKSAFLNFTPGGLIYKHWDSIAAWFGALWGKVKTAFSTAWTNIKTLVSQWAGDMKSAGMDIVSGIIAGITAKWTALKNKISAMGGAVVDWFKGKKGIDAHSPSRKFAVLGGYITDGLAMGIDKGEAGLMRGISRVAGQMTKPFAKPFNSPGIAPKISLKPVIGAMAGLVAPISVGAAQAPQSDAVQATIAPPPAIVAPPPIAIAAPAIVQPDALAVPSPAIVAPPPFTLPVPRFAPPAPLSVTPPAVTVTMSAFSDAADAVGDGDGGDGAPPFRPDLPPPPPPPPSAGAALVQFTIGDAGPPARAGGSLSLAPVYNIEVTLNGAATSDDEQRLRDLFEEMSREHAEQLAADVRRNMHD